MGFSPVSLARLLLSAATVILLFRFTLLALFPPAEPTFITALLAEQHRVLDLIEARGGGGEAAAEGSESEGANNGGEAAEAIDLMISTTVGLIGAARAAFAADAAMVRRAETRYGEAVEALAAAKVTKDNKDGKAATKPLSEGANGRRRLLWAAPPPKGAFEMEDEEYDENGVAIVPNAPSAEPSSVQSGYGHQHTVAGAAVHVAADRRLNAAEQRGRTAGNAGRAVVAEADGSNDDDSYQFDRNPFPLTSVEVLRRGVGRLERFAELSEVERHLARGVPPDAATVLAGAAAEQWAQRTLAAVAPAATSARELEKRLSLALVDKAYGEIKAMWGDNFRPPIADDARADGGSQAPPPAEAYEPIYRPLYDDGIDAATEEPNTAFHISHYGPGPRRWREFTERQRAKKGRK